MRFFRLVSLFASLLLGHSLSGQVLLFWEPVLIDSATVRLERAEDDGEFQFLVDLPATSSWYRDESAQALRAYRYQARTIADGVQSEPSNVKAIELTGDLVNISTRMNVTGDGEDRAIAGFVIKSRAQRVLIRAVGPTLGDLGISNPLPDPRLILLKGSETIAENDDWADAVAISAAAQKTGAFSLKADSKDAALVIDLAPGLYTAHVLGVDNAKGIALVEIYSIP